MENVTILLIKRHII